MHELSKKYNSFYVIKSSKSEQYDLIAVDVVTT